MNVPLLIVGEQLYQDLVRQPHLELHSRYLLRWRERERARKKGSLSFFFVQDEKVGSKSILLLVPGGLLGERKCFMYCYLLLKAADVRIQKPSDFASPDVFAIRLPCLSEVRTGATSRQSFGVSR